MFNVSHVNYRVRMYCILLSLWMQKLFPNANCLKLLMWYEFIRILWKITVTTNCDFCEYFAITVTTVNDLLLSFVVVVFCVHSKIVDFVALCRFLRLFNPLLPCLLICIQKHTSKLTADVCMYVTAFVSWRTAVLPWRQATWHVICIYEVGTII